MKSQRIWLVLAVLVLVPVSAAAQTPVRVVGQRALTVASGATSSITTNGDAVCFNVDSSMSGAVLTITGTWTGTISPRARNAAGTLVTPVTGDTSVTSTTSNTAIGIANRGYTALCLSATASMTGTAVVSAVAGGGGSGGGGGGSVTQGTDPWITSGTLDELPAAAAGTDATATPTASKIYTFLMAYNGTTWDFARTNLDPCAGSNKTFYTDSQAAGTQVLTGTASNKTYICSIMITQAVASTQRFSVVAGTGSVCATNTVALIGDTAGSTGMHTPFVLGNGGATIAKSTVNADNICVLQSTTDAITVSFGYVVAP